MSAETYGLTEWPTVNGLAYCPDHGAILPGDGRCPYFLMDRRFPEAVARHPERTVTPAERPTGGAA